jgi:hypothetical protein
VFDIQLPWRRSPLRRTVLAAAGLLAGLLGAPVGGAAAQRAAPPAVPDFLDAAAPRAQVLLLGTFHFDNPGRDAYKPRHDANVLSPARQREVGDVVAHLAAFRPTRVAVEWSRERQGALDSLYREYRAGRLPPRAGEVFQLGFRLAAQLGHERVYAVDVERHQALLDAVMPYERDLEAADSADVWGPRYRRIYAWEDSVKTTRSLREQLRYMNAPATARRGHGAYLVGYFKGGGDTSYVGPDFVAGWFDRNLRIFRNLQRLTGGPAERLLVIYGAGHLATLRHFVESSPEYRLVEAERYLGR